MCNRHAAQMVAGYVAARNEADEDSEDAAEVQPESDGPARDQGEPGGLLGRFAARLTP
ncbi:MAG: hypothetical protein ABEJ28_04170 [Salinigranum sp.]